MSLGVFALGMNHSKLWVTIIINTFGAISLGWSPWELIATAATPAEERAVWTDSEATQHS